MNRPNKIITHHALSSTTYTVEMCDLDHAKRWPGFISRAGYHVGYHYFINWEGEITQTRDHDEEGAHCIGQNTSSIGVCFVGNFDKHMPSQAQIAAWWRVWNRIHAEYPNIKVTDIYPHRMWAGKTCHGALLDDHYFADLIEVERKTQLLRTLQALLNRLVALLAQKRMSSDEH